MKIAYKIALPIAALSISGGILGVAIAQTKPTQIKPKVVAPIPSVKPTTPTKLPIPTKLPTPAKSPTVIERAKPNPPLKLVNNLTPALLGSFTKSYGKIIGTNLTPKQQNAIAAKLRREWQLNLGLRSSVIQIANFENQLNRNNLAETEQIKTKVMTDLRQQVLDGDSDALWLISYYDKNSKNWLVKGASPLTQMTADTAADALCFMVNEVLGKPTISADSQLKKAVTTKLIAEYPTLAPSVKSELSQLTMSWLRFKQTEWIRRGEDFREEMRVHWGQNLEPYIPELKAMLKLRQERLARLKAEPTNNWYALSPERKTNLIQLSQLNFQQTVKKSIVPVASVPLTQYLNTMSFGKTIATSPTRYPLRVKVK
jgi:hypothetical protein